MQRQHESTWARGTKPKRYQTYGERKRQLIGFVDIPRRKKKEKRFARQFQRSVCLSSPLLRENMFRRGTWPLFSKSDRPDLVFRRGEKRHGKINRKERTPIRTIYVILETMKYTVCRYCMLKNATLIRFFRSRESWLETLPWKHVKEAKTLRRYFIEDYSFRLSNAFVSLRFVFSLLGYFI